MADISQQRLWNDVESDVADTGPHSDSGRRSCTYTNGAPRTEKFGIQLAFQPEKEVPEPSTLNDYERSVVVARPDLGARAFEMTLATWMNSTGSGGPSVCTGFPKDGGYFTVCVLDLNPDSVKGVAEVKAQTDALVGAVTAG